MADESPVVPELNRRMLLRGGLAAGACGGRKPRHVRPDQGGRGGDLSDSVLLGVLRQLRGDCGTRTITRPACVPMPKLTQAEALGT